MEGQNSAWGERFPTLYDHMARLGRSDTDRAEKALIGEVMAVIGDIPNLLIEYRIPGCYGSQVPGVVVLGRDHIDARRVTDLSGLYEFASDDTIRRYCAMKGLELPKRLKESEP